MGYEMAEAGASPAGGSKAESVRVREPIDDPDRDLVVRWQGGDSEAFTTLVRRHEGRVFRLLMRMTGSREEAEDVSQETFLSLHRHGHRFRYECRFSTFVYRVAANAALNRRRSLKRSRDRIQRLEVRQAAGDDLPHSPRNPEDQAAGFEIEARVQEALLQLPDSLRLPVVLYEIESLAYGEIASVLGLAEGTVKSRIHRARQVLRTKLRGTMGRKNDGA
ncbi:sigma-70 family RNA polymerase sigma factor [Myxococcota bacterium]|nr:sigma-70 family RNA polymerase sigma factor [Myxococcota bacterium]